MQKYNIEDNIDFFFELNKLLNKENSANGDALNEEEDLCLISNEKLTDKFIKLNCGHSFNYTPLFKDLVNQKQKFNIMEISELKKDEIRCPYCRAKQQGVLPYYEELGLPKINGVNTIEKEKINVCEYSIPNLNFNPMLPENDTTGNGKFIICPNAGSKIAGKNYGDEKCYCAYHKKIVIHYAKEDIKLLKLKAKEDLKQEKIQKLLLKQQQKLNKTKGNINNENIIIENNVFTDNIIMDISGNSMTKKCKQKLKTGINKGNECGCKIFMGGFCKRHYNLNINETL
jgi:DNA-directed RNA polymerase subunit RPC12/RpoP